MFICPKCHGVGYHELGCPEYRPLPGFAFRRPEPAPTAAPVVPGPAVIDEWAERFQCAEIGTDYPLTTEDGYSGWLEQPVATQERYRGLVRLALAAGMVLPAHRTPDARELAAGTRDED